jgi:hypothetical protein
MQITPPNPFSLSVGVMHFQHWMVGFDPNAKRGTNVAGPATGLPIPIWITLCNIPDEFRGVANQIAQDLGDLIGADPKNNNRVDPRFYVSLNSGCGWEPLVVVANSHIRTNAIILVD